METKTHSPSFTVSLRGYDREEVDQYIDSLAEALEQVDDSAEHNRRLQAHINRLNARIKDLEDRINSETPRTGVVVGERIGILLREAEDAATETLTRSEANAAEIVAEAEAKRQEAEDALRAAISRGEEQARRIDSAARAEASEIVAEAEGRASARTRQIEQWAEQVISHTRAEEARMLREQQDSKRDARAELDALTRRQEEAAGTLTELRDALGHALGLIEVETPQESEPSAEDEDAAPAAVPTADEPSTAADEPSGAAEPSAAAELLGSADEASTDSTSAEVLASDESPGSLLIHSSPLASTQPHQQVEGPFDNEAIDAAPEAPPVDSATNDDTPSSAVDVRGNDPDGDDAFEAKLEAWVSGGSQETIYRYK